MMATTSSTIASPHVCDEGTLARGILDAIPLPLVVIDSMQRVLYMSQLAETFFGVSSATFLGRDWRGFPGLEGPCPKEAFAFEEGGDRTGSDVASIGVLKLWHGQRELAIEVSVAPMPSPLWHGSHLLVFRDATPERNAMSRLAHLAHHDALTHLCNRREFERRVEVVIKGLNGSASHALFFIDLDGFKLVNDTAGHAAGDDVLRQVARLFASVVRERDTLARLGGDEFGLLLEHCPANEALQTARLLRTLLHNTRFEWRDRTFDLGMSVGIVPVQTPGVDVASLIATADEACYRAKRRGLSAIELQLPVGS